MKTLVINGSAQKDSDTSFLINCFLKDSTGEVVFFDCFFCNFSACIDCKSCADGVCKKSDDMQNLYKELETYDNIIIASPVYFGNLTPPVLSVLSRLQCYYKNNFKALPKVGKEKNGILILTAGNSKIMYAKKYAGIMFKILNAKVIGTIESLNTDIISASKDESAKSKARNLNREIFRK